MKLVLKLGYKLNGAQSVCVEMAGGSHPMQVCDEESMSCEVKVRSGAALKYNYCVSEPTNGTRREWGAGHNIPVAKDVKSLFVSDVWYDMSPNAPFFSSLFTQSIYCRQSPREAVLGSGCLMVEVRLPMVEPHHSVVMVGSSEQLGAWDVSAGVAMADVDHPTWRSEPLELSAELLNSEYKFVIVDTITGSVVAWEQGVNRNFAACKASREESIYVVTGEPHFDLPAWRGTGVAIPLFSLRSANSMGVGEFADLKLMVEWAVKCGMKVIQILPINDSTMTHTYEDSYPYNANSSFALHPQYISLREVGKLRDKQRQTYFEAEGARLNALPQVDYCAVNELKRSYLMEIYTQQGAKTLAKRDFKKFYTENSYWLDSYALYSLLRDRYNTPDSQQWGSDAEFSEELLSKYKQCAVDELGYYYFVQYHLHMQLLDAHSYAQQCGVAFKGDIPIGVSRMSADVWVNPRLFRLDSQAGAPPDDFSVLGQNWGFPTYNWEEMALDGYAWWRGRFEKMSEYFDAYRIDHILGFFRIWEIPLDAVHGLLGYFNPALPLTEEQMQRDFGFEFCAEYARPAITNRLLQSAFGERAEDVAAQYLDRVGDDLYQFKVQYNSQVLIQSQVEDRSLHEGLLLLFTELLFVEDPHHAGHYHPRISAQNTHVYQSLSELERQRYDALYNDFYYCRHNDFWRDEAMRKLPTLISATSMLTCGEDLGMIPHCVPDVMNWEQILSLEIQRMPKAVNVAFGDPALYPYRSVCTTSTHDMNPIRAWLLEDKELSRRYFRDMLGVDYMIEDDCPAWICELIVRQHLASPSMWTILPFQDWLSVSETLRGVDPTAERINIPSNPRHYWRYRMHLSLEELLQANDLNEKLKQLTTK